MFRFIRSRIGSRATITLSWLAAALAAALPVHGDASAGSAFTTPWKLVGSLAFRESYDSNIFLQSSSPAPTIANAKQPNRPSAVTTTGVTATLERKLSPELALALNSSAEAVTFASATAENYRTYKLGATAGGQAGTTVWSAQTTTTRIDGGDEGPVFGCTGGATALGGIPLRDRRSALVERARFKLTHPLGAWFVRTSASFYVHDFLTHQSPRAGYLNYVDRREYLAGAEVGREMFAHTRFIAGVCAGRQDQFKLHGIDSPYDSWLRRFVIGLEGKPAPWLQLNLLGGPETRRFRTGTPAGFDRDRVLLWLDSEATITVGPRDTFNAVVRRFEQPAFTSQSVYEDITYEVTWRRKLTDHLTLATGFKAYGGDWPGPVTREDWIFTPSAALRYAATPRWLVEVSYLAESAESRLPATPGREYRRQIASVSTQLTF